jgi:hypothetical protein
MVPASISDMMEALEAGSMMSANQVAGMAVAMTLRMELGTESRRIESSPLEEEEEDEVPVPWGAARAVPAKRRAAMSLNCILDVDVERMWVYKTNGRTGKQCPRVKRVTV